MSVGQRNWSRRLISVTFAFSGTAILWAASPLLFFLAILHDLLRTGGSAVRALMLGLWGSVIECAGLLSALGLFLWGLVARPSASEWLGAHYALQRWWSARLISGYITLFSAKILLEGEFPEGPVLLLVRHTSLADTVLPMWVAGIPLGRRPRYILKKELLWEPCLDVVGNRLPNLFVDRKPKERSVELAKVSALAEGMKRDDFIVIFPEGTRFTEQKRERRIQRLAAEGKSEQLELAKGLRHLLPPRRGGIHALFDARPDAAVVLLAHSGLERLTGVADLLSGVGVGAEIRLRMWSPPRNGRTPDEAVRWIEGWWLGIDQWVEEGADGPVRWRSPEESMSESEASSEQSAVARGSIADPHGVRE